MDHKPMPAANGSAALAQGRRDREGVRHHKEVHRGGAAAAHGVLSPGRVGLSLRTDLNLNVLRNSCYRIIFAHV